MNIIFETILKPSALVVLVFLTLTGIPLDIFSQNKIESLEPEQYFDFWVGNWELTWEAPDGSMETGSNRVEKVLDGTVILENFEAKSGRFKGYKGKSFSVYHKQTESWRQTWVDNNQGYIDLKGIIDADKRIFQSERPGPDGNMMKNRMVFYDISDDSLTWDWESSSDGGETWTLNWRIFYKRMD